MHQELTKTNIRNAATLCDFFEKLDHVTSGSRAYLVIRPVSAGIKFYKFHHCIINICNLPMVHMINLSMSILVLRLTSDVALL
jgi:hypothetical protein